MILCKTMCTAIFDSNNEGEYQIACKNCILIVSTCTLHNTCFTFYAFKIRYNYLSNHQRLYQYGQSIFLGSLPSSWFVPLFSLCLQSFHIVLSSSFLDLQREITISRQCHNKAKLRKYRGVCTDIKRLALVYIIKTICTDIYVKRCALLYLMPKHEREYKNCIL